MARRASSVLYFFLPVFFAGPCFAQESASALRAGARPWITLVKNLRSPLSQRTSALQTSATPQSQSDKLELALQDSVLMALKKNLRIQIAELNREAFQTEVPRTRAKFHPTVGFTFTATGEIAFPEGDPTEEVDTQVATPFLLQELPTGGSVVISGGLTREGAERPTPAEEFTSGLSVSLVQPLMRGGRVFVATRQIRDAEFDVRIEEAKLRAEILKIVAATKTAYYNVVLAERVIEVTQAAIERDRGLIEASDALLKAGLVTKRDLFSAEISLAKDTARLATARADLESANQTLFDVLGLSIGTQANLTDREIRLPPVLFSLEKWIETATTKRPEIEEAEARLAKSLLNVRVARNTVLPQVDLVATYNRSQVHSALNRALDFRGRDWTAGVVLSIPIGNVAARSALSRAEIEHRRLERELVQKKREVEVEVRNATIKLQRSRERINPLQQVVDSAQGKLEIARDRFALGLATNLDIVDAQEDLLDAETDLLNAMVDYNIGLWELEAAIAGTL